MPKRLKPDFNQLVYFPYLSLGDVDEIRDGYLVVWNADRRLDHYVPDEAVRNHVRALLDMNRVPGREAGKPKPIRGIGVVSIGSPDFRVLSSAQSRRIRELRTTLFLSALSNNASIKAGANSGHWLYTTENFDLAYQNFIVGSEHVSERAGFIVETTIMGYTIGDTRWFRPRYVPNPSPFRIDATMFSELTWLRRNNLSRYRRTLRAASVFMESYYNAPNVDISARVLLQLIAFEILLNIPDDKQRMHFKQQIGTLCRVKGDRKRPYRSERPGGRKVTERGNLKTIWADTFYTLRNHLIHGEVVEHREFMFRGVQHHLAASPVVFVAALHALMNQERIAAKDDPRFTHVLRWQKWTDPNDLPEKQYQGFALEHDWSLLFRNLK